MIVFKNSYLIYYFQGPVKVPMTRNFSNSGHSSHSSHSSSALSRSSVRTTSSKDEKESGYDSYQESISSRDQV